MPYIPFIPIFKLFLNDIRSAFPFSFAGGMAWVKHGSSTLKPCRPREDVEYFHVENWLPRNVIYIYRIHNV